MTFSTLAVRAAYIKYTVFRTTNSTTADEAGTITINYNPNGTPGSLWEMGRKYIGDGKITFYVTDVGQVQLSTTALSGLNHAGKITYSAVALLQS